MIRHKKEIVLKQNGHVLWLVIIPSLTTTAMRPERNIASTGNLSIKGRKSQPGFG
jgi:hypothetical protein